MWLNSCNLSKNDYAAPELKANHFVPVEKIMIFNMQSHLPNPASFLHIWPAARKFSSF
jgi:hypothetical protein